ncbi:phage tail fiber protein [Trabulsiella guamensis ATCC 49490]|uniref:Phage tail fiber protein n=1 Tax=Trabulsiella guamensis ATCC 49490 TaxID=1005994 RepID=A0A085AFN3_9ENTR|nr:phage tail protein [Trabulsiella guamensis]KFC09028.1 phage tail fiber protein [Trabulsiella guamensis ATCC 49490]
MSEFYGILTAAGAAACAHSVETGQPLNINTVVIGDGNGTTPQPVPEQTDLVNTVYTGQLNSLTQDSSNPSVLVAEVVLPAEVGPFWCRELGLKADDGTLIAVCSLPPQYKVVAAEGAAGTMVFSVSIIFSDGANVTLTVDDSAILATKGYIDMALAEHIADPDAHPQYVTIATLRKHIPTGVPLPWPTETPPTGWLKCNGATFSKTLYPILGAAYPSGQLPDLRAEFIRGWDDGRNIDTDRGILSQQDGTIVTCSLYGSGTAATVMGVLRSNSDSPAEPFDGDAMNQIDILLATTITSSVTTGLATVNDAVRARPRNVAFNYIVRAE